MTPAEMARLHAAAFMQERSWQADEFKSLLEQRFVFSIVASDAFAVIRTVAGETELIMLAVNPAHQRQGLARALLKQWLDHAQTQAEKAFLEVAVDNAAAIALYETLEFQRAGLRKAYYARRDTAPVDALLMTRTLTQG